MLNSDVFGYEITLYRGLIAEEVALQNSNLLLGQIWLVAEKAIQTKPCNKEPLQQLMYILKNIFGM